MLASDIHTPTTNVFDVLFKGKPLILFSIYISGLIEVIIHEDNKQTILIISIIKYRMLFKFFHEESHLKDVNTFLIGNTLILITSPI